MVQSEHEPPRDCECAGVTAAALFQNLLFRSWDERQRGGACRATTGVAAGGPHLCREVDVAARFPVAAHVLQLARALLHLQT